MGIPLGRRPPGSEPGTGGSAEAARGHRGRAQLAGPPARARRVPHVHFHGVVADRLVVLPATIPSA
ncbi:hypothetical protein Ae717Ps2_7220 [Pseudonocardia sp. Ae717_Ps2]|nr:hypothetical protein Ae717Ps2_7220 [Pseudonocardia sp. Ae717_Ps2]